jgi:hypothetical protein
MLKRTPIRRKRSKPRRGKPTVEEKAIVRRQVYERARGRCELRNLPDCIKGMLPFHGLNPWDHGHLVHLVSEGAGGPTNLENCRWGCWRCHLIGLHNPKSVPAK